MAYKLGSDGRSNTEQAPGYTDILHTVQGCQCEGQGSPHLRLHHFLCHTQHTDLALLSELGSFKHSSVYNRQ